MPRKKNWRKAETRKTEWTERSRTDSDGETTERYKESPSNMGAGKSSIMGAGRPSNVGAQAKQANKQANEPVNKQANVQANISQSKLANVDLISIIAKDSSTIQTDFETVFFDAFPDVVADYQSRLFKDLSENESITVSAQDAIIEQHEKHHKNVTAQLQTNGTLETSLDNDVVCYQAIRSSDQLWNASDFIFGNFHQNDARFSEQSRGYQCTCNALCMLSYSLCHDIDNGLIVDEVLCEGDALYQTVISRLKSDGKFMNQLLSLEEIPDEFEVKIGKFTVEKLPIVCGPLVDTQDLGLPTLHDALQSAFLSISSGLVTIGAICSAVFKKNELYIFFDSHCHGENGLSSSDGASCLMTFSSLDDLITYMYAFYDSLKLDTGLQFDFLPINLKRCEEKLSCKDEMARHLEAYFKDQNVRQAKKTQSNACAQHKYASKIESLSKKRKPRYRTEYYKISKQLSRMDPTFKAKELMNQKESKQSARKDPAFKAKEIKFQKESKQSERRNPTFKAKEIMYQKESKQTARKHPAFKRKEIESKQSERRDPTFKAKEIMYQKESKQTARKNPAFKRKEIKSKQSERRDPAFKAKEIMYQKESKQSERRNPIFKAKEIKYQKESKQSERRNPIFKAEEIKYQKESKQTARKNPAFKRKENESKQSARKHPVYKTKERESKQLARRNPSFRTKETVYQKESK